MTNHLNNNEELSTCLHPLKFVKVDDGSILIEWIYSSFRIGFSVEKNEQDSFWYLVSNFNMDDDGTLNVQKLDSLLFEIIYFVSCWI